MELTFATRPSNLARWQTSHVIDLLQATWDDLHCEQVVIKTKGDRVIEKPLPEIGGKGLFTHELEEALREGRVDAAVHSLKDLPTEDAPGLTVGVIPMRADARDVLICPAGYALDDLPSDSVEGTSSNRRRAQILAYRQDLWVKPVRGNVETRLRKVHAGEYDALVLAAAGIVRLGLENHISQYLPFDRMLPAPGQGALAVQCRADDAHTLQLLRSLDHPPSRLAVRAERFFLAELGGGCSLPVGALGSLRENEVELHGVVAASQGQKIIRVHGVNRDPREVGVQLARQALAQGASEVLP